MAQSFRVHLSSTLKSHLIRKKNGHCMISSQAGLNHSAERRPLLLFTIAYGIVTFVFSVIFVPWFELLDKWSMSKKDSYYYY